MGSPRRVGMPQQILTSNQLEKASENCSGQHEVEKKSYLHALQTRRINEGSGTNSLPNRTRRLTVNQAPTACVMRAMLPIDRPQPRHSPEIMRPVMTLLLPPLLLDDLIRIDLVTRPLALHVPVEKNCLINMRMLRGLRRRGRRFRDAV